jgi:hypothetical protein
MMLLLAPALGGCTPGEFAGKVLEGIETVMDAVQVGIVATKATAARYCTDVGTALNAANQAAANVGASCKAKNEVSRIAAGVASFCNNLESVGDSDLVGLIAKLKKAKTDARAAIAAGC